MLVPVRNMAGETVQEYDLRDDIFGIEPNVAVMHQAALRQMANARLGTHKTKSRSEVSGGGRKPYRQKGTGNARQGSTRAPQYKGGGVVFGPTPRSYAQKMNRKMRRLALRSALSQKLADEQLMLVDRLSLEQAKTQDMAALLGRLDVESTALILLAGKSDGLELSARNLPQVKTLRVNCLSVRDLLRYDTLIVPLDAADAIHNWLSVTK